MEKKYSLSADRVNLIIALCAILISLASFYATYLQASAAEKQVKAMTHPLMGFAHGNYDKEALHGIIYFAMSNSGMGAAIIRDATLRYKGEAYKKPMDFIRACCGSEYELFESNSKTIKSNNAMENGGLLTGPIGGFVMAAQSNQRFLALYKHERNQAFWNKLNNERWAVEIEFCYCTLLDDCFKSKGDGLAIEVESCDT